MAYAPECVPMEQVMGADSTRVGESSSPGSNEETKKQFGLEECKSKPPCTLQTWHCGSGVGEEASNFPRFGFT